MAAPNAEDYMDICPTCKRITDGGMVACDKCNVYHHFACVGVDATIADRDWLCPTCKGGGDFRPVNNLSRSPPTGTVNVMQNQPPSPPLNEMQIPTEDESQEPQITVEELLGRLEAQQLQQEKLQNEFANMEERAKAAEADAQEAREALAAISIDERPAAKNIEEPRQDIERVASSAHVTDSIPPVPSEPSDVLKRLRDISARQKELNARVPNLRIMIPPTPSISPTASLDVNEISSRIIQQLSATIPAMVQAMTQQQAKPTPFHFQSPFEQHSQPVIAPATAPVAASFEKLAATMQRKYLQKLPIFNGDEKAWAYFEAIYESTTADGNYSEADNVARLREALKKPALDLVLDQVMFTTNATAIMADLRDAYGRPERLVVRLMDELLITPDMKSATDPKLRDFAIHMKSYVANIKALKRPHDLRNDYALGKLLEKVHVSHYKEWTKLAQVVPGADLETFADFLMRKVKEIPPSMLTRIEANRTKQFPEAKKPRLMLHNPRQSTGITAGTSGHQSISCAKCRGPHRLPRCAAFANSLLKERWSLVFKEKICSACLVTVQHKWVDCPEKRLCNIEGCDKFHHRLLHNPSSRGNNNRSFHNPVNVTSYDETVHAQLQQLSEDQNLNPNTDSFVLQTSTQPQMSHTGNASVLFKILKIRLHGANDTFLDTFAYLDDGSSITLMDRAVFDQLNLDGTPEQIHLQWTKGITRTENSFCTNVAISGSGSRKPLTMTNVFTVENLDLPEQSIDSQELKKRYKHLRGLPLPNYTNAKPQILIGLRHASFLLSTSHHVGSDTDPIASKTRLGWVVYGAAAPSLNIVALVNDKKSGIQQSMYDSSKADEELHSLVKGFFTTENFGVMSPKRNFVTEENQRADDTMRKTLRMINGRYEIGLLWKADNIRLPDSFPMAMSRLIGLEKSLKKSPDMLAWKNKFVDELLEKGYARVATKQDLEGDWPRIWYCPTFVVVNKNKIPPKPRVVADVAAKVNGQSLNSNLLKGPDNLAPLVGALYAFREKKIAVNGDVKEMFPQMLIPPEDQQCQRFLWRYGDNSRPPTIFIMQRMMFGPTCSPACAQFVKNTHADQYIDERPEAVEAIKNKTYVDDYFNSHSSVDKAVAVTKDAIGICADMGFDLTGFQSNSADFLAQLPPDKVKSAPTTAVGINDKDSETYTTKVLGMFWQPDADMFTFKLSRDELLEKLLEPDYVPTKREILKMIMRIFDPLGLISHFLIRGKIIMQEIWRDGTGWDQRISKALVTMWKAFLNELLKIEQLQIPRKYTAFDPTQTEIELIVFVDASENAFCATAYFRFINGDQIEVAHVMAKCKVAPVKMLSIPHLEIQSCVLGARIGITIKAMHTFRITVTRYVCDAKVALSWITSSTFKFKTFVAVRVGEILESTTRSEWFHIRSKDNVADDGTKWINPDMGDSNSRWFKGPAFLKLPFSQWPITPACERQVEPETLEVARAMLHHETENINATFTTIDDIGPRFTARWLSLARVIAFLLRARQSAKGREKSRTNFITPSELDNAERQLFKKIQQESFPEELRALASGKSVPNGSRLKTLCPFLEDGLIRMSGRTQKAKTTYAAKNPIILPNKHKLVDLVITHFHERNFHMGEATTIADIREKLWIVDVRSAVQRVARQCQLCKNLRAMPRLPLMGELPAARLEFGMKPFTHTGLDAFGPYLVKFGRGTIKRWGLIFTCLTYRAVHIEVLNDMTTDQCVMAIRRFLVRRGACTHFYSDSGTNFVGAKNKINAELKALAASLGEELSKLFKINWHFQPAYSPWFGGSWERLIQSIKKCADYVMNGETPREDVFRNAMIEAEFWMNRRPLTHIPINHEDDKPLTPNTALFGDDQNDTSQIIGIFAENDAYSKHGYKRAQHLVNKFMSRWVRDYLPTLNRREKWNTDTHDPIKVGDVVIVTEPNQVKEFFKKGRVVQIHPGPDGKVRAADVQLGDKKKTILKSRSAGRIAVLDVQKKSSLAQPSVLTPGGMSSRVDPSSNEN